MSQTMTAAERSARAKLAADARWEKQQAKLSKWHTLPLDEAMNALVDLRREVEDASKIIAERQPRPGENGALYDCYFCHSPHKKYVYVETPINKDTGLYEQRFICSPVCYERYMKKKMGGVVRS